MNGRPAWLSPRRAGDVAVVGCLALIAWLAVMLHDSVEGLGGMAVGIRDTGTAIEQSGRSTAGEIRRGIDGAADAIESVPVFGADVARRVREAGARSADAVERETRADGRRLVEARRDGQRDPRCTARLLGWVAFLVPSVLLVALWLTRRGSVRAA